jgi:hypothetical protein
VKSLDVEVIGIGAWAVGCEGWPALMAVLQGRAIDLATDGPRRPTPALLPPAERRRAPDGVAVALEVAREAVAMASASGGDATTLASVFASAHGDLAIVDYLCETLASDPLALSPTRFHLSVHNAAAGYWSIATHDMAPMNAVAAGDESFALGLLEAATLAVAEQRPVLLVAFDTPAVGLLTKAVTNSALFGMALVMRPADDDCDRMSTRLSLTIEQTRATRPLPHRAALLTLSQSSPAARALALAEALAPSEASACQGPLDYPIGANTTLSVVVRRAGGADRGDSVD